MTRFPCPEIILTLFVFLVSAGRVTNISLQGRSLTGFIPDAVSELPELTALFLHFNELQGGIPASLSYLEGLTDMYLNWNQLSGAIPPQLGQLASLQGTTRTSKVLSSSSGLPYLCELILLTCLKFMVSCQL